MTSKLTGAFVVFLLCAAAATASAQTLDDLAARGEALANADPLSAELRNRQPEGPARRGFDIGMAAAEGQTAPGPGKDKIRASLPSDASDKQGGLDEQRGFDTAVEFSLERNRNADLAAKGAAIAQADEIVAAARTAEDDVFYWLGFDIAMGIFGDPALGAQGNTAVGPGSLGIRDALSAAGQRGFNASAKLRLGQAPPSSAPAGGSKPGKIGIGEPSNKRSFPFITNVQVVPRASFVDISYSTLQPAGALIEISTQRPLAAVADLPDVIPAGQKAPPAFPPDSALTTFSISSDKVQQRTARMRELQPNTTYYYVITTGAPDGSTRRYWDKFRTIDRFVKIVFARLLVGS